MKLVTDGVEFLRDVINHPCHVCMQKFIQIHERIMSNLSIQCMDVGVNYVSRGLVSSGLRGSGGSILEPFWDVNDEETCPKSPSDFGTRLVWLAWQVWGRFWRHSGSKFEGLLGQVSTSFRSRPGGMREATLRLRLQVFTDVSAHTQRLTRLCARRGARRI